MNEKIKLKIGLHANEPSHEDNYEVWRFTGAELVEMPDPEHPDMFTWHLYECPGGYRVAADMQPFSGNKDSLRQTVMAPSADDGGFLLSEEETVRRFRHLLIRAGKVQTVDLDTEEAMEEAQSRRRVKRFGELLRAADQGEARET